MSEKSIKATLAQSSQDYLKLLAYVQDKHPGDLLEYLVVATETGIKMDAGGKGKLRRAILRSHLEYAVVQNVGYKLAQPDMTMGILTLKLVGIDNKVRRAERAHQVLQEQFLEQLPPDEQKGVLYIGAVFGAIRQSADRGKELYRKEPKRLSEGSPQLPDNV
jgi:hypothetical protein